MGALKNYLSQPSTWRGFALLLTLAGVSLDPDTLTEIGVAVVGAIGVYEVVRNERSAKR